MWWPWSGRSYDALVERVDALMDCIGDDEQHPLIGFLHLMGDQVAAYDAEHREPIAAATGIEVLRHLMREHALTQAELTTLLRRGLLYPAVPGFAAGRLRHQRGERANAGPRPIGSGALEQLAEHEEEQHDGRCGSCRHCRRRRRPQCVVHALRTFTIVESASRRLEEGRDAHAALSIIVTYDNAGCDMPGIKGSQPRYRLSRGKSQNLDKIIMNFSNIVVASFSGISKRD